MLRQFIQKAFIANYIARNTEMMKTSEEVMMSITVPSRNGSNITSNLKF